MAKIKEFFKRKDVTFTLQRYGIDALGAMAQGLFCTLLVGTILNTIGQQFHIGFLNDLRRMNVAITRARMKLVILGDATTLTRHPFYHRLHAYIFSLRQR